MPPADPAVLDVATGDVVTPVDQPSAGAVALRRVVAALPGGGEARPGQAQMAEAVAAAVAGGTHLVVQAGTGTGKTLAYLVPALLAGKRTVVATATKALQDQLVGRDLPFLARHLDRPISFAALKGRSNYLCLQRAHEHLEAGSGDRQLGLAGVDRRASPAEIRALVEWSLTTDTGDRAHLDVEPTASAWSALSVSAAECPGAAKCPIGTACFAERAKHAAAAADVVVVNLHLYGAHLASGGAVLPDHDVLVVDEAHQLEEIISATAGVELGPGRFSALARAVGAVLTDVALVAGVDDAAALWGTALLPHRGRRVPVGSADVAEAAAVARGRVDRALDALRRIATTDEGALTRRDRAAKLAAGIADDLARVVGDVEGTVCFVEGTEAAPVLRVAPVDVAATLEPLWDEVAAVLTSATIPVGLSERVGLPEGRTTVLDVGSPFDFAANGLLYCAAHLPDPRNGAWEAGAHEELAALITAAGGRTLALFTSWRAMTAALDAVRPLVDVGVLAQGDRPKPALVDAFTADEPTCLFATLGFWQGIDVPGRTLSLVVIDRLPFPRPDDPLTQARRERAGARAFGAVDLPRATTLLAQGAGRLLRSGTDRGVVAVLDPRLAKASYRWDIVRALPPMRRTRHRAEAEAFLREITTSP
ncbi:MAG: ATP-dependent DNA helicase [Acidimicrobiales bacterium]